MSDKNWSVEHELKCWPEFFGPIERGEKTFEIRLDDRNFRVGDVLWLREWIPATKAFTGRECRRTVSYITEFGQVQGQVVMALRTAEAERLTLERAAKVCERRAECRQEENAISEPDTGAVYYSGRYEDEYNIRDEEDQDCADAIRALAQPINAGQQEPQAERVDINHGIAGSPPANPAGAAPFAVAQTRLCEIIKRRATNYRATADRVKDDPEIISLLHAKADAMENLLDELNAAAGNGGGENTTTPSQEGPAHEHSPAAAPNERGAECALIGCVCFKRRSDKNTHTTDQRTGERDRRNDDAPLHKIGLDTSERTGPADRRQSQSPKRSMYRCSEHGGYGFKLDCNQCKTKSQAPRSAEAVASSRCPMCGVDVPHAHYRDQVIDWLRIQARRFLNPGEEDSVVIAPTALPLPDGWKAMPTKLTTEMQDAVLNTTLNIDLGPRERIQRHYDALLRTAPVPNLTTPPDALGLLRECRKHPYSMK